MTPKEFLENVNILDNEALFRAIRGYTAQEVFVTEKYFLGVLKFISDALNCDPPNLQAAKNIVKEVLETNQTF